MSSLAAPESYDVTEYDDEDDEMNFVNGDAISSAYQGASENDVESQVTVAVAVDDSPSPASQREQTKRFAVSTSSWEEKVTEHGPTKQDVHSACCCFARRVGSSHLHRKEPDGKSPAEIAGRPCWPVCFRMTFFLLLGILSASLLDYVCFFANSTSRTTLPIRIFYVLVIGLLLLLALFLVSRREDPGVVMKEPVTDDEEAGNCAVVSLREDPGVVMKEPVTDDEEAGNCAVVSLREDPGVVMKEPVTDDEEAGNCAVVNENVVTNRSIRMLKPVQGPVYWEAGRRYLIAPAALPSCSLQVLRQLHAVKVQDYTESAFGTIELGTATCKYVGPAYHDWNTCNFLLKQNYLMEYEIGTTAGTPRGVAHLQFADCYPHDDFPDALELKFYGSPCSRADTRVLFVRVANREERDRWVRCLNDAAQLTIKDLYDYDEKETAFGKGRYAVVYPARRRVGDSGATTNANLECALKIIDKDEFWRRVVSGEERAHTIVRETSVQATLTARCGRLSTFLHIRGIFETVDHFVLELELPEGTDLYKYVSSKGVMEEEEAAQIMRDIFKSIKDMTRIGIAHRDIKPANVLMCDREKCGVSAKLADFGMSGFAGIDGHLRGRCGTPGFVAPEMWTAGVGGGYGNKVDVFSAGVTLFILLCGYEPFFGETNAELIAANKAAIVDYPEEDWSGISSEARDLVERMLERDPKKRISAKEALEHPWIVTRAPPTVVKDGSKSLAEEGTACTIS